MSTPTPEILLPCPFCGDHRIGLHYDSGNKVVIECSCGMCVSESASWREGRKEMAEGWNTRPANPLSPAEAKKIREALEFAGAVLPLDKFFERASTKIREALALLEKAAGGNGNDAMTIPSGKARQ